MARLCAWHLLALLVGTAAPTTATAKEWDASRFPNPTVDLDACGRHGVKSWVCDPDKVLSYEGANVIEGVLKDIEAGSDPYVKMPCGTMGNQGFQVSVNGCRATALRSCERNEAFWTRQRRQPAPPTHIPAHTHATHTRWRSLCCAR